MTFRDYRKARYLAHRAAGAVASDAFAAATAEARHGGTYRLPQGWTWADVAAKRRQWGTPRYMLPLAGRAGVMGWAVPLPRDLGAVCPHVIAELYRRTNAADVIAAEARAEGDYAEAARWDAEGDDYAEAFRWAKYAQGVHMAKAA